MTTIAISEGVVACDTQATGGNEVWRVQKLVRLPDGGVAAGAGLWRAAYVGLRWLENGEPGEGPDIEGAVIAIVRPDKSIWIAEGAFPAYPLLDREIALGCGSDLARAYMAEGYGPAEAVAKACELDNNSSDPLLTMAVEPRKEPSGPTLHKVRRVRK